MGSGGTHCDVCRKRNKDCECLPERVELEYPCCPWCGEDFETREEEYTTFLCHECEHTFEAQRKVFFISRAKSP